MNLEIISHHPTTPARPTPLLFVHGAWHGAWCWEEYFLPYFAEKGYAAHALSLRGHGNSAGRVRWSRMKHYVADVATVAGTLPSPPVVIGHSMGGFVVQKYLEQHAAPAGVLLAAAPTHGAIFASLRTVRYDPLGFLQVNLSLNLYPIMKTPAKARHHLFSDDLPAAESYHARLGDESYPAYLDMLLFALPRPKRVKAPLLVLGAAQDRIFAPWEVERTARAYGTQAQIFPNMAHDMMLEAGWEAVAARIVGFLQERGL